MIGITRTLDGLDRVISGLAIATGWVFLLPMIVFRFVDIIGKQFLDMTSDLVQAYEWDGFFVLVFLSFGYGYLRDGHARIDVLRDRFSPRTLAWVEVAGLLLALLPFSVLMIIYGIDYVATTYSVHEGWWVPYLDRWAKKAFVPFGFVLLTLAGLTVLLRNILFLAGGIGEPAPSVAPSAAPSTARPVEEVEPGA
jgi:TRAP-type mannitol/chloroaromatic compound transport system permease small subunit